MHHHTLTGPDSPGVMVEAIPAPFTPGLPHGLGVGKRFEPLKRRTKDSPPPPWDSAALAAYFGGLRKNWEPGPGVGRIESKYSGRWFGMLEPLPVGRSLEVEESASAVSRGVGYNAQKLNRTFRIDRLGEGRYRVTRVA